MIEKLSERDMLRPLDLGAKLNKLIDAYNELEEKYMHHFHLTEKSETTGPNQ